MTDTVKIKLGGVEYDIAPLTIKHLRHVEPLVARHSDYFLRVMQAEGKVMLLDLTDQEAVDFSLIAYHVLTKARPDLTLEQFEALPIKMREVMEALPAMLKLSGLFRDAKEGEVATGEAAAPPL